MDMDEVYFVVRFTPFWSIPLMLLGMEFAYLFWLRKKKKLIAICSFIAVFSLLSTVYYYWAGGPVGAVKKLSKIVRFYID